MTTEDETGLREALAGLVIATSNYLALGVDAGRSGVARGLLRNEMERARAVLGAANPAPADDLTRLHKRATDSVNFGHRRTATPAPAALDVERLTLAMCDKAPGECFDWPVHVTQAKVVASRYARLAAAESREGEEG